jgi:hypothetical protein
VYNSGSIRIGSEPKEEGRAWVSFDQTDIYDIKYTHNTHYTLPHLTSDILYSLLLPSTTSRWRLADGLLQNINIIRGRARHPLSQGSIKQGNKSFKAKLRAVQMETGSKKTVLWNGFVYDRKAFSFYRIDFKNSVLPYLDVFQKHVEMVTFL